MNGTFTKRFDGRNDRTALTLSFLTGLLIIIYFRSGWYINDFSEVISNNDLIATGMIISIIFIYVVYIKISNSRTVSSIDRASDNAYYLGLVFTLLSLSVSLLKLLNTFNDSNVVSTNIGLLPDFGLALASTIAGIIGRIYLQQFKPDEKDIDEKIQTDLSSLIERQENTIALLIKNLDGLANQTEVTMKSIGEDIRGLLVEVTNNVSNSIAESTKKNEEMLESVALSTVELAKKSNTQIEKFVKSSEKIDDAILKITKSFEGYKEINLNIENLTSNQIKLTSSLNEASNSIDTVFAKLNSSKNIEEFDNSVQKYINIGNSIETFQSGFIDLNNNLRVTNETLDNIKQNINNQSKSVDDMYSDLENASKNYVEALTESVTELSSKIKKL